MWAVTRKERIPASTWSAVGLGAMSVPSSQASATSVLVPDLGGDVFAKPVVVGEGKPTVWSCDRLSNSGHEDGASPWWSAMALSLSAA